MLIKMLQDLKFIDGFGSKFHLSVDFATLFSFPMFN